MKIYNILLSTTYTDGHNASIVKQIVSSGRDEKDKEIVEKLTADTAASAFDELGDKEDPRYRLEHDERTNIWSFDAFGVLYEIYVQETDIITPRALIYPPDVEETYDCSECSQEEIVNMIDSATRYMLDDDTVVEALRLYMNEVADRHGLSAL